MKRSELKKLILEILTEFNLSNENSYPIKRDNREEYSATILDDDSNPHKLDVYFQNFKMLPSSEYKFIKPEFKDSGHAYNIAYLIDGKETRAFKTKYTNYAKIMSSVLVAIKSFINETEPEYLYVKPTSLDPLDSDYSKKQSVYNLLAPMFERQLPGYKIEKFDIGLAIIKYHA